jgi:octaprenyl-diphosphate synthase
MTLKLESIKRPIEREMQDFEVRLRQTLSSEVPLLDRITYYIAHRKGKQVRPMLVLLTAKLFGDINSSSYTAATMVELLHTATLVHDDVVDESDKRRGFFSINALWKNKVAVLVGDYFLSKGLMVALENDEFLLLKILNRAVKAMSEGELLQIAKARKMDIKEDIYYQIIEKKTAAFIAAACTVGAASITDDQETLDHIHELGINIGMAFQIRDDLFDYGKKEIGKPVGIDIKEKKLTLPLIYALQQAPRSERRRIINIVRNQSHQAKKVREVIDFAISRGGLTYASQKMYEYRDKALAILDHFPDNEARSSLKDLVEFVTERRK